MMKVLEAMKLPHVGQHHSGIDDTKNTANIAKRMIEDGLSLEITSSMKKFTIPPQPPQAPATTT